MSYEAPRLIQVVELGAYPNFSALYQRMGFQVETINVGRKAISMLKKSKPEVVVTEFNYQFEFRDRTSHLESILAVLQPLSDIRVVVFYDKAEQDQLEPVRDRFPGFIALPYPIEEAELEAVLG
ncbi:MAG: hypothetical protein OQK94_00760 [Gammaproteobacteria bacterium]|nr:hypothetical protein [Gammaproteobacteria bacterium]MCW8958994.1 hypothetical protein [Gammaproteobacteria bacterium]MCW8972246.1 hypothetical protein [Gammaproteobacteria bacterium]MCW8993864.1 hypothetical protein [Gammaproteobacteria bacterium]